MASEFHYLKGICYAKTQKPDLALQEFSRVINKSSNYDSSLFKSAVILTYEFANLDSASYLLNQLIKRNSHHYAATYLKGLIYEMKSYHKEAFDMFSSLVNKPFNQAAIYYHLARSEIKLNLSDSACAHLEIASNYNLLEAKQMSHLYCEKEAVLMSQHD